MAVIFLLIFVSFLSSNFASASPLTTGPDFSCSADSPASCQTYVTYISQLPNYNDLGTIADLFGVSHLSVSEANKQVSGDRQLVPGQPLLIPVNCGCTGSHYFANVTYKMKTGDTYFYVSATLFENLTNLRVVKDLNLGLNPTLLIPGSDVIFPLFCKCPSKAHSDAGVKFLVTYVWQSIDDVFSVSSKFDSSVLDMLAENNYENMSAAAGSPILIPVSQLPQFPLLPQPRSPKRNSSKDRWIYIAIKGSLVAFLIALLAALVVYTCKLSKKRRKLFKVINYEPEINHDKLLTGISQFIGKSITYEKEMIMEATMNLDEHCRIGSSMYKGNIYGKDMAVKQTKGDIKEELNILQKVNHVNLVSLLGTSSETDGSRFLVYEYAENGSLEKWLHLHPNSAASSSSSSAVPCLSWSQRVHIALDVANGLHYMHDHTQPNIVHWNVRSKNILLDSKFKAKLTNFSMARTVADPTMLKVDVFAFGIVLLELLSGKKALTTKEHGENVTLCKEIREVLRLEEERVDRIMKWMDPKLDKCYPIDGALSLAALAWTCTQEKALARPKMEEVVFNLSLLAHSFPKTMHKPSSSELEPVNIVEVVIPVQSR